MILLPFFFSFNGSASFAYLINVSVPQALASLYSFPGRYHSICFYMLIMPKPPSVSCPTSSSAYSKAFCNVSMLCPPDISYSPISKLKFLIQKTNRNHLFLYNILIFMSRNLSITPDCSPFANPLPQIKSTTN